MSAVDESNPWARKPAQQTVSRLCAHAAAAMTQSLRADTDEIHELSPWAKCIRNESEVVDEDVKVLWVANAIDACR